MKKTSTLFFFLVLTSTQIFSQGFVLLPSAGVQTTTSRIQGFSPAITSTKQYQTNVTDAIRGFMYNRKGHGLFFGVSTVNHGISVKTFEYNAGAIMPFSSGSMSTSTKGKRLEIGYQLISKPVYINRLLANNDSQEKGLFLQIQPLIGLGYNFQPHSSTGSIGSSSHILTTRSGGRNLSLLTGTNIYIGKKNQPWFFISVMRNSNFGNYYSSTGILTTSYNNTTYKQNVNSFSSGTSYSIGIPIRITGRKNKF